MKRISKQGWLVTMVIVLALLNIGLMGMVWFGRPSIQNYKYKRIKTNKHGVEHYLERQLKLNRSQRSDYRLLRNKHFEKIKATNKQIDIWKGKMYALIGKGKEAEVDSLAMLIGNLEGKIELMTFRHFEEFRMVCTPNQRPTFDSLIKHVAKGKHKIKRKRLRKSKQKRKKKVIHPKE